MKTVLFKGREYYLTLIGCFAVIFTVSFISAIILPSSPIIDYGSYYGSNYWLYVVRNWSILTSFMIMFIFMGLLMAERIIKVRGYYEILQKGKERKDT